MSEKCECGTAPSPYDFRKIISQHCPLHSDEALAARDEEIRKLQSENKSLREIVNFGDYECLPECDSVTHADKCPVANPEQAWKLVMAELAELRDRADELKYRLQTWDDTHAESCQRIERETWEAAAKVAEYMAHDWWQQYKGYGKYARGGGLDANRTDPDMQGRSDGGEEIAAELRRRAETWNKAVEKEKE